MQLGSPLPIRRSSTLSRIIGAPANPLPRLVADPNILDLASTRLVDYRGRLSNTPSIDSLARNKLPAMVAYQAVGLWLPVSLELIYDAWR
jgi:hypothetical protein